MILSYQYSSFIPAFAPTLACHPLLEILSSLGFFFLPSMAPWTSFSFSSVPVNSPFPIQVPYPCCFISLQLLCQNPLQRLRHLHHFQVHPFFRGVAFDPELLQKQPVNFAMETQATQPSPSESMLFKDFDCNLESYLVHSSPTWGPRLDWGAHLGTWGSPPLPTQYDHLDDPVCFYFVTSYHCVLLLGTVPEFKSWAFCYRQP